MVQFFFIVVYEGVWCDLCECVRDLEGVSNEVHLSCLYFGPNRCVSMVNAKDMNGTILCYWFNL